MFLVTYFYKKCYVLQPLSVTHTMKLLCNISMNVLQECVTVTKFCSSIVAQYSTPGEPQQNGVAERRNGTLMDMVKAC